MNLAKVGRFLLFFASFTLTVAKSEFAAARPVTFVDGWSLMTESRAEEIEAMVDYTFTRRIAAGVHVAAFHTKSADLGVAAPILNLLALRANTESTQLNVYGGAGAGLLTPVSRRGDKAEVHAKPRLTRVATVDADAESRTLYASIRHESYFADSPERLAYSRARFGFSPFLGDIASLHVWTLVQWDYDHWRKTSNVTPMLRFFYQNVLWELGVGFRGEAQINWTIEL